jgi:four helix bundle protein
MQQSNRGNLLAQRIATDAVRLLRPLAERIQRHDKSLADQLKRAASSVVLNLAEAAFNNAGHRRARLESARGSANETRAALALADAWGYIQAQETAEVDALYDRVLAMTYPLWARA